MVEVNCDTKIIKGIAKMTEKYKDNLTKKKSYVKGNLHFLSKCSRENYEDTLHLI